MLNKLLVILDLISKTWKAGLNQLLTEYTDVNTDRGRFAQIAEYSPEYIAGSLSNIGNMMQSSVMSRQPGWNAGFQANA